MPENLNLIAIVAHNLNFGGAAVACARLVGSFKQHGYEVATYSIHDFKSGSGDSHTDKFKRIFSSLCSRLDKIICRYLNPHGTHWSSSGLIGQITSRKILEKNPSFLNIHWIGHATISLKQISKINIPILITAHDQWWLNSVSHYTEAKTSEKHSFIKKLILKSILQRKEKILRMPNVAVVCLSQEMLQNFLSVYPYLDGRVMVIPNPVDDSVYHSLKLEERLFAVKTAAYLGGFSDTRKGHDLLLEVLKKCHEKFNVVATGFTSELLSGVDGQIRIVGIPKISNENELNQLYNNVEITIVPSRQEALPQVATESLMAGTPVISFRVGGLRDILIPGISGFIIDNFDTTQFAERLDSYMKSPVKNEFHATAFAFANFSRGTVVKKYLDFYESLTNHRK